MALEFYSICFRPDKAVKTPPAWMYIGTEVGALAINKVMAIIESKYPNCFLEIQYIDQDTLPFLWHELERQYNKE